MIPPLLLWGDPDMAENYTPRHAAQGAQERREPSPPIQDPELQEQIRRYQAERRRNKLRWRRRARHGLIVAFAVLLVFGIVMLVSSLRHDDLKGAWALDDTTVYEFDGRGHGTLRLPLGSYAFSYATEGDYLTIDFEDETAIDAGYIYERSGNVLTLDTDTGTVYRLTEEK